MCGLMNMTIQKREPLPSHEWATKGPQQTQGRTKPSPRGTVKATQSGKGREVPLMVRNAVPGWVGRPRRARLPSVGRGQGRLLVGGAARQPPLSHPGPGKEPETTSGAATPGHSRVVLV